MTWNQLLSNQSLKNQPTLMPDLRTQVQPFQDLQPEEIQDQLQKLHIQLPPDALVVIPTQQQQQGQNYDPGLSSVLVDNGYANPYTTSESNTSVGSSRKSSKSITLIPQLCLSPPALPISSPQTDGSSSAGSTYTPAMPSSSFPPSQLNSVSTMYRSSQQDTTAIPTKRCRPQRSVSDSSASQLSCILCNCHAVLHTSTKSTVKIYLWINFRISIIFGHCKNNNLEVFMAYYC